MKPAQKVVSIYLPITMLAEVDAKVARLCQVPGRRSSRNAWIVDKLWAALAAESTAPDQPSSIGPAPGPTGSM